MANTNFADGPKANAHGQSLLDDRNAQKRAAATKDPYADTSAINAAKAKRARWSDGTLGNHHTPRQ